MKKVRIDKDACIGCGLCVGTHPELFDFDDDGKVKVIAGGDDSGAEEALNECPVGAIIVE